MVGGRTKVCFLLGYPLGHSRSPLMHNAAFAALGLDYVYVPLEVRGENLSALLFALRGMENFGGANVTVPHKIRAMDYLDGVSEEAHQAGAVNTLYRKGAEIWGENTDGRGFLASLREEVGFDPRGRRVMVLGAGGAARAVVQALVQGRAEGIYLVNRTEKRAQELASLWKGKPDLPSLSPMGFSDPLFPQCLMES
ncbi:MAG: shikimate dehydrogenase, partial [candidate division NC10 bacterium]|nr:shikimate dehydrogenase [candidate division NC10 bacterium]